MFFNFVERKVRFFTTNIIPFKVFQAISEFVRRKQGAMPPKI